mgnify:CR=1 FL=1
MQDLLTMAIQIVLTDPFVNPLVYQHVKLGELPLYGFLEMKAKLKPCQLPISNILANPVVKIHRNLHVQKDVSRIPKSYLKLNPYCKCVSSTPLNNL